VRLAAILLSLTVALTGCLAGMINEHFSGMTKDLQEHGVSAEATILKIWDTGWTVNNSPVIGMQVEVRPPDGPAFEATIKKTMISRIDLPQFQPGKVVPVLYDPKDLAVVAVDFGGEAAESENAPPPILGVAIRSLNEEEKARFNRTEGALVLAVTEGLPAAAAGIRRGDILLTFDGKPVADADALRALVGSAAGRSVAIDLDRDGRPLTVTVQLNPAAP
jgi:membrane-associated protease RseP (regulator of RpoE activity)